MVNNPHLVSLLRTCSFALELKLAFTKTRSNKRPTSCLPQPPRSTEMYKKIEKVLKDHMIVFGLVKPKQSDRAEIIPKYFLLKMVLGQVTGEACKHPLFLK